MCPRPILISMKKTPLSQKSPGLDIHQGPAVPSRLSTKLPDSGSLLSPIPYIFYPFFKKAKRNSGRKPLGDIVNAQTQNILGPHRSTVGFYGILWGHTLAHTSE